jgi:hypothetical protein
MAKELDEYFDSDYTMVKSSEFNELLSLAEHLKQENTELRSEVGFFRKLNKANSIRSILDKLKG